MELLEGYATGLAMVVFVGPLLFLLLSLDIEHGLRARLALILGVTIGDAGMILLCRLGLTGLFTDPGTRGYVGAVGAAVLLVSGVVVLVRPPSVRVAVSLPSTRLVALFARGFAINFFNPLSFLVWAGLTRYSAGGSTTGQAFIWAVLAGGMTADILKAVLAQRLQRWLTPRWLVRLQRASGGLLIGFGLRLLWLSQ